VVDLELYKILRGAKTLKYLCCDVWVVAGIITEFQLQFCDSLLAG
jgi:hypothetical protein